MTRSPDSESLTDLRRGLDVDSIGQESFDLMQELFPICRSITGDGLRETLAILQRQVPELTVESVPSGTQAFDWTVPQEWNIKDAFVRGPSGQKVIDFADSNLHVVSYSEPVARKMPFAELAPHLHTLPEHPTWIPYRTSYYERDWGFCLTQEELERLEKSEKSENSENSEPGDYEVVIDSSLEDGEMNYAECLLPGESDDEVLISAHVCHPSLCNDNLSGVVVATALARMLRKVSRRYSYRFLFIPGGIGSVLWMSRNQDRLPRIKHGLVLNCLGDAGNFTYKRSRRGEAEVDQAAVNVLRSSGRDHSILDFSPYGYDERNYGSAKFNLPVGSLTRSTHSNFPGYHSSGDGLETMAPARLGESVAVYLEVLDALERNRRYQNLIPEAEPQLGKRGLYGLKGGLQKRDRLEVAMLWVMNLSDGDHTLLDISDRSGLAFDVIVQSADLLVGHGLLEDLGQTGRA